MSEKIINIQDAFLNYMRKNKVPVTIFLLNGVKLTGTISCFDQSSIVIKREGYTQLVYKTAISTFSPHGPINVFDWNATQSNDSYRKKQEDDNNNEEEIVIEIEEEEDDEEEEYE
jgi:host factor-I protein